MGLIYFSLRLFISFQLYWQAASRPWYSWDYITQTPFEIYEKTSGRVQRPDTLCAEEGLGMGRSIIATQDLQHQKLF